MTCPHLYQELQKCRNRCIPSRESVASLTSGQKTILLSQINNAEMVDTQAEEITIKIQAGIVYKFMIRQDILLVSNDHATPYPESQKKIWDILLSLELASQTLIPHTTKQVADFLYRINPTKGKTSTTISHSASPFWKTFSEQIPKTEVRAVKTNHQRKIHCQKCECATPLSTSKLELYFMKCHWSIIANTIRFTAYKHYFSLIKSCRYFRDSMQKLCVLK